MALSDIYTGTSHYTSWNIRATPPRICVSSIGPGLGIVFFRFIAGGRKLVDIREKLNLAPFPSPPAAHNIDTIIITIVLRGYNC